MNFPPLVSKIFYAILISPLQSRQSSITLPHPVMSQPHSRYNRTVSIVNSVDKVVPGLAVQLSRLMYKNNRFPWRAVDSELIAFGTGAAVFKVNWKNGNKVLRIYRKSLGKSLNGLLEIVRHYRNNYETLLALYGSALDLVLPIDFLIFSGLPFGIAVAASLQPFIDGQKRDLFEDFSDDELLGLLKTNAHLREQFITFTKQTLCQWIEQKECFDFLGRENLMVVNQGENYRLCIADVGLFDLSAMTQGQLEKIKKRVDRLASLYEMARKIQV